MKYLNILMFLITIISTDLFRIFKNEWWHWFFIAGYAIMGYYWRKNE